MKCRLGIDVGGTFTDLYLWSEEEGRIVTHKVPSTPRDPSDAIVQGVQELLEKAQVGAGSIGYLSHGTTVATNTILQKVGAKVGMVTTRGFRDLLEIGRQKRPVVYDLFADKPAVLVGRYLRKEVRERMAHDGTPLEELDMVGVTRAIEELLQEGIEGLAVCFLHSYANPQHESAAKSRALQMKPEVFVSASHELTREFREFERFLTTVLNTYVGPALKDYMIHFGSRLKEFGVPVDPYIIQSNGGLLSVGSAVLNPIRTVLSGPSAGVIGAAHVARAAGLPNVITLDMGGTSTDVSLVRGGRPSVRSGQTIAGYSIRVPAVAIHTIGAGGGSIAWVDEAMGFHVGPRSAGAKPGPSCYGLGGDEATVTDANVMLGRLNPQALLGGAMPICKDNAVKATQRLADAINLKLEAAAAGVIRVVVSNMVRAVRVISIEQGEDPREFALLAFGGAGPLHASAIARQLGISDVIVPLVPGLLCAAGALLAEPKMEYSKTRVFELAADPAQLADGFRSLTESAEAWLKNERIPEDERRRAFSVDMRYVGQNHELTVDMPDVPITAETAASVVASFHKEHYKHFGYSSPANPVQVVTCRVTAMGRLSEPGTTSSAGDTRTEPMIGSRPVYFETTGTWMECPVYWRGALGAGCAIEGPAIVEQTDSTTLLYPDDRATVDGHGNMILKVAVE